ncbi:potassium channel family protein [Streptomyces sp. NBC_00094]|uniref:potassium channel family protein n=1 Tax=Streptomyces sp. NBC_00094 TaxID=2903620 RepID=UPI00225B0D75|nr:potassium channel family protein [Streptomyces sp. NBC_00094]MCX5390557.1 potassium channel family protein [Streptomyces sp. NBC_00094]
MRRLIPRPRSEEEAAHFRVWALVLSGLTVLIAAYFTLPLSVFRPSRPVFSWVTFVVILTILAILLLKQIRSVLVDDQSGRPALGIPLLVGLSLVIFATAYLTLSRQHGEFDGLATRTDALYFTVITMSTVGYGDVAPTGQTARLVVTLQIVYNFVFIAAAATAFTQRLRSRVTARMRARGTTPVHPPDDPEST